MFDVIRADLQRASAINFSDGPEGLASSLRALGQLGTQAVVIYRYGSWVRRLRIPIVKQILAVFYWILKCYQVVVCQVHISQAPEIGPGFVVHNGGGVYVHPMRAGRNLYVSSGVVIGYAVQSIGDDVYFGVGAKAHGGIRIGNNVSIAANAVVSFNVPDNSVVLSPSSEVRRTGNQAPEEDYLVQREVQLTER